MSIDTDSTEKNTSEDPDTATSGKKRSIFHYITNLFKAQRENLPNVMEGEEADQEKQKQDVDLHFSINLENFAKKTAEDVMIPRSDIIAVEQNISRDELVKIITQHNHTRTLIYQDSLDNVTGFIHIKDLFEVISNNRKINLTQLARRHLVIPYSMKLLDLLLLMKKEKTHMAVVVDEYGGTDGIVTVEDVIESIVGRIDDEHDEDYDIDSFKIIKPGLAIASARMEIADLENALGFKIYSDRNKLSDFYTISGLILAKAGYVPLKGEIIEISEHVSVEVLDATPRAIRQIKIIYDEKGKNKKSKTK